MQQIVEVNEINSKDIVFNMCATNLSFFIINKARSSFIPDKVDAQNITSASSLVFVYKVHEGVNYQL